MSPYGYNLIQSKQQKVNQNHCAICGKTISHDATYCVECGHIVLRKVERPDADTLAEEIRTLKGFAAVGRKYNVTDNTIKKWCKYYGLPTSAKAYKEKKTVHRTIRSIAQIDPDTNEIINI